MRLMAAVLSVATAMLLTADLRFDVFRHTPGGSAFDIRENPFLIIGFATSVVVAFVRPRVGGVAASVVAGAYALAALRHLRTPEAVLTSGLVALSAGAWMAVGLVDQPAGRRGADNGRRRLVGALGLLVAGGASGLMVTRRVLRRIYGPTHPGSPTPPIEDALTSWVWTGAVTAASATITAQLSGDNGPFTLQVSSDASMTNAIAFDVAPDADGFVRTDIDGLAPGTTYHYGFAADGSLDPRRGVFRTAPVGAASFDIACASCSRTGSNGVVWDTIRTLEPDLMIHMGDFHYADIDQPDDALIHDVMRHQLRQPAIAALFASTPVAYVWDDHDWGGNDSTVAAAPAAHRSYRRFVPHYDLAGPTAPVHQAFTLGRVRFVMTDARAGRLLASGSEHATMLGSAQKAWFLDEMRRAGEENHAVVWINPVPWIAEGGDGDAWDGFVDERREIADFLVDHGLESRLVMVSGDAHMVAIDDGTNSDYSRSGSGGFPVLQAAALDRPGTRKGGPYSHGTFPGGGQFGHLSFRDDGRQITVTMTGRNWRNETLVEYRTTI